MNIIKLYDLVSYHIAVFVYTFKNSLLPPVFDTFFSPVSDSYQYNTTSAAKRSYYLPRVRTNYGKFSIRFQGPKIWNLIDDHIKSVSFAQFKLNLRHSYLFFFILLMTLCQIIIIYIMYRISF